MGYLHLDDMFLIDHSGQKRLATVLALGNAFARKSRCVEASLVRQQDAVEWNLIACVQTDGFVYLNLFRQVVCPRAVSEHLYLLLLHVEQRVDVTLCLTHGAFLKFFSDGVEQHHGYGLGKFADTESANGCQCHQYEFIEPVAMVHSVPRMLPHRPAYGQIGQRIQDACRQGLSKQMLGDEASAKQQGGDQNREPGLHAVAFMVVVMTVAGASAAATAFFMIMWFHILCCFMDF